jgi:regulator of protease activity HflC (stomatin/prohibitin superfamily)
MGFVWLEWLGQLVKLFGDLIPQRVLVEPTHKGIKYKGMKTIVVLEPGRYWYWPFFTMVHQMAVVRVVLGLQEQKITTKDGKVVAIEGMVSYEVTDIVKAMTKCFEVEDQIDDECMAVLCTYITKKTFDEIQTRRTAVNKGLTEAIRTRMLEYGINVIRVQLTTFATGVPIVHIGNNKYV